MYIERCEHLVDHPPGDDWNGVWGNGLEVTLGMLSWDPEPYK